MATKPTIANARWATSSTNMTAPSSGTRDQGWSVGDTAISSYDNVIKNEFYKWAQYLDEAVLTGAFQLASDVTSTDTGTQNDWNPTGWGSGSTGAQVIRSNAGSPLTLNGLAGGADGRICVLLVTNKSVTLRNDNAGSTAANRFFTPGGYDLVLAADSGSNAAGSSAILVYDSTSSRWRVVAHTGKREVTKRVSPFGGIIPPNDVQGDWDFLQSSGYLKNDQATVSGHATFVVPIDLPVGATLTTVSAHVRRSTDAVLNMRTRKAFEASVTTIGTDQATSTASVAYTDLINSGLSEVIGSFHYWISFDLTGSNDTSLNIRIEVISLTYLEP